MRTIVIILAIAAIGFDQGWRLAASYAGLLVCAVVSAVCLRLALNLLTLPERQKREWEDRRTRIAANRRMVRWLRTGK
jgi:hypothetical protein